MIAKRQATSAIICIENTFQWQRKWVYKIDYSKCKWNVDQSNEYNDLVW